MSLAISGLMGIVKATFYTLLKTTDGKFIPQNDYFSVAGKFVQSFAMTVPTDLNAAQFEFVIIDPAWEFIDHFDLHLLNKDRFLVVKYRFGWTHSIWGDASPTSPELLGYIINATPVYGEISSIALTGTGAQMEDYLESLRMTYNPTGNTNIKTIKDLYIDVAKLFKIDIEGLNSIDPTPITALNLPDKPTNITGLDYLALYIWPSFRPSIGGALAFARFDPFISGGGKLGKFVIQPQTSFMDDKGNILPDRTYSIGLNTSKVLTYSPSLNPWLTTAISENPTVATSVSKEKQQESVKAFATDVVASGTATASIELATANSGNKGVQNAGTGINLKSVLGTDNSPLRTNQTAASDENTLQNAVTAELEVFGDYKAIAGKFVRVDIYHPLKGSLVATRDFFIKSVQHSIANSFFTTILTLVGSSRISDAALAEAFKIRNTVDLQGVPIKYKEQDEKTDFKDYVEENSEVIPTANEQTQVQDAKAVAGTVTASKN